MPKLLTQSTGRMEYLISRYLQYDSHEQPSTDVFLTGEKLQPENHY